jgi:DUF1680 family protein
MTTDLSRRHLFGLLGLLAGDACRTPSSLNLPRHPVADALSPLPLGDVRLGGALGRKLDLCIRHRIFAQDPEALVEPFRHRQERTCWQTEFWGKWFLSAAAACSYTGDGEARARLAQSVRELLATQTSDGYIGNYAKGSQLEGWDVWGRKYTLLGLLAWYDLAADPAALNRAQAMADQLLRDVGPTGADIVTLGLYRGMAASSVLEPMVGIYRRTHRERYLRFAEYILERWSSSKGPQLIEKAGVPVAERFPAPKKWWSWENGQKAYEMMSCYAGLVELYRETGWAPALNAAVRTFESIRDTEINVAGSGSAAECWWGGKAHQTETRPRFMETCVGVTWMQLCAHLLRVSGDPRYADEIERTAYNALAGAMTPDGGSFAQYSSLEGVRALGERHCGMELNCCVANGPRGMMLLPEVAVLTHAAGPAICLYSDGVWKLRLPSGAPCHIEMKTDYPFTDQVDIRIEPARPEAFALRLRIPQWSEETSVSVNGASAGAVRPGTWAVLERRWKAGDLVRLRLDLRARILTAAGHAAVIRGPLALARDVRLGGGHIDEPVSLGSIALTRTAPPAGIETAFAAAAGKVILCDYASAGNTWDARSRYRTWLPVA